MIVETNYIIKYLNITKQQIYQTNTERISIGYIKDTHWDTNYIKIIHRMDANWIQKAYQIILEIHSVNKLYAKLFHS